jgi:hypothetical protein
VKHPKRTIIASALLAAGLAASGTALAGAQQQPAMQGNQTTGTDTSIALLVRSAGRMDAETQMLAGLKNQVPQKNVVPVPVDAFSLSDSQRHMMMGSMTADRRTALLSAMDKVTVASEDRPNGASPDQQSLTEYLKHLGINPRGVVAVDVNTTQDPQNPIVTLFYRKGALKGQQQGGPG